jgi:Dullard-like phosphatase family protein
LGPQLPKN